ncbi:MAG TPA: hypothetical protein VGE31_02350 [Candidatus Paceibacterota bacterium]
MLSGETTFTIKEIKALLVNERLVPGTDEFQNALRQRFIPTDSHNDKGQTLYIENMEG